MKTSSRGSRVRWKKVGKRHRSTSDRASRSRVVMSSNNVRSKQSCILTLVIRGGEGGGGGVDSERQHSNEKADSAQSSVKLRKSGM